jgi:LmbE family N-acetylglucosaminyl deacetylase
MTRLLERVTHPFLRLRHWRRKQSIQTFSEAVMALLSAFYSFLQTPVLWFVSVHPAAVPSYECMGPERILVIAPHPDDDILAVGGTMAEKLVAGASLLVVYLTSGDANRAAARFITMNPFYSSAGYRTLGLRRQKEAVLSLRRLGLSREHAVFLNYPDRGLTALLETHWRPEDPYVSPFTGRDGKYSHAALNPTGKYCGTSLVEDLVSILGRFRPTIIYVPHPQDAHPDHVASYRLTLHALNRVMTPSELPDTVSLRRYVVHLFEGRWPVPGGMKVSLPLSILPASIADHVWVSTVLSERAVALKLAAIRAHYSQWMTSRGFLAGFVRTNEIYSPVAALTELSPESPVG